MDKIKCILISHRGLLKDVLDYLLENDSGIEYIGWFPNIENFLSSVLRSENAVILISFSSVGKKEIHTIKELKDLINANAKLIILAIDRADNIIIKSKFITSGADSFVLLGKDVFEISRNIRLLG